MSKEKPLAEQVDDMRTWAKGVEAQLKEFDARILPTVAECDALSVELGALYDKYALVRDDAREARNSLGEIGDELRDLVEQIKTIEAQASLDAFGLNEVTGKPFTVAQTANRTTVALAANDDYQALTARKRQLEGQKAGAQAVLADAESAFKEYGYRKDALKSRLDNLTARLGR